MSGLVFGYLADDDGFDVVEGGGVERVEDEVGRRVDGHLGVQALEGDEAAEVERVDRKSVV